MNLESNIRRQAVGRLIPLMRSYLIQQLTCQGNYDPNDSETLVNCPTLDIDPIQSKRFADHVNEYLQDDGEEALYESEFLDDDPILNNPETQIIFLYNHGFLLDGFEGDCVRRYIVGATCTIDLSDPQTPLLGEPRFCYESDMDF